MAVRITCINKDNGNHENPHVAISRFGWVNPNTNATGSSTREQLYDWVKNKNGVAFVQDGRGNRAFLIAKLSSRGNPFLQTVADGTPTDNLLRLPECVA